MPLRKNDVRFHSIYLYPIIHLYNDNNPKIDIFYSFRSFLLFSNLFRRRSRLGVTATCAKPAQPSITSKKISAMDSNSCCCSRSFRAKLCQDPIAAKCDSTRYVTQAQWQFRAHLIQIWPFSRFRNRNINNQMLPAPP